MTKPVLELLEDLKTQLASIKVGLVDIYVKDQRSMYERCPDCEEINNECTNSKRCKIVPNSELGEIARKLLNEHFYDQ